MTSQRTSDDEIKVLASVVRALLVFMCQTPKEVYAFWDRLGISADPRLTSDVLRLLERFGKSGPGGDGSEYGPVFDRVFAMVREQAALLASLSDQIETLGETVLEPLAADTLGIRDNEDLALPRVIGIDLFADRSLPDEALHEVVESAFSELGFELIFESPAEFGSTRKRWFARSTAPQTKVQVTEALNRLGRTVELRQLDSAPAGVDEKNARAFEALFNGVEDAGNVALRDGSLLLVKTTNESGKWTIAALTLTERQLLALYKRPHLIARPEELLAILWHPTAGI